MNNLLRLSQIWIAIVLCAATVAYRWAMEQRSPARSILAPSPALSATRDAAPPPERCPPVQSAQERIDEATQMRDEIAELRVRLEGEPIPWPDDVDPRLEPDTLESAIKDALTVAARELRWVQLDCSEDPCIVVVDEVEPADGHVTSSGPGTALSDALALDPDYADFHYSGLVGSTTTPAGTRHLRAFMAIFSRRPTLEHQVRVHMRITDLLLAAEAE